MISGLYRDLTSVRMDELVRSYHRAFLAIEEWGGPYCAFSVILLDGLDRKGVRNDERGSLVIDSSGGIKGY